MLKNKVLEWLWIEQKLKSSEKNIINENLNNFEDLRVVLNYIISINLIIIFIEKRFEGKIIR